jgi:MoaA/NifB/PqqE/SkfB family radical SAM enzyme
MQKQTVAFSKKSVNLFFHILTKCNLSCTHCYINPKQHGSETLDIITIKTWLKIFSEKAKFTNLIFLGGEPTLHPELSIAVKIAGEIGFKSITIDTNGYLFHNILDKISPDEIDFISFSLDGATRDINDLLRGRGSYDKVLAGINSACEKGFSCSMIYTVSGKNLHEIGQMPDLLRTLGIKRFFIQVIGIRGSSSQKDQKLQLTKKEWQTTIPEIAKTIAEQGIIVTYPKVFLEHGETFECGARVAENYFIFPNGRVYQCPICEDFPLHSFHIRQNTLIPTQPVNEKNLFSLDIPEGCVMNKLIQPGNIQYNKNGKPAYKIACCMLKQEVSLEIGDRR